MQHFSGLCFLLAVTQSFVLCFLTYNCLIKFIMLRFTWLVWFVSYKALIKSLIKWLGTILLEPSGNQWKTIGSLFSALTLLHNTIYCIAHHYTTIFPTLHSITALQQHFCFVSVWQVPSLCLSGTGTMWRGTTWNIIKSVNWTVEDITSPLELSLRRFNSWSSITWVTHIDTLLIPHTQYTELSISHFIVWHAKWL